MPVSAVILNKQIRILAYVHKHIIELFIFHVFWEARQHFMLKISLLTIINGK